MKHELLVGKTDSTVIQLIRYTIVGGGAFLLDISILYLLTDKVKVHYAISAALAFLVGLLVNYVLSKRWVFSRSAVESRTTEFMIFFIIGIVGLGINEIVMIIFTEVMLIYYLASKMISTITVYFWNFFARKFILFR